MKERLINHVSLTRRLRQLLVLLTLLLTSQVTWAEDYDLWIGDVQVTSDNWNNIQGANIKVGYARFIKGNDGSNTLQLHNIQTKDCIKSGLGDLTIELYGHNRIGYIANDEDNPAIYSTNNGTLTLTKGSTHASLYVETMMVESVIYGFEDFNYMGAGFNVEASGGLYSQSLGLNDGNYGVMNATFYTGDLYPLWVGETQVSSANLSDIKDDNISEGTVSYNPDTNTLTMTNVTADMASDDNCFIESTITDLKVNLLGTNEVTLNYGMYQTDNCFARLKTGTGSLTFETQRAQNLDDQYVFGSLTVNLSEGQSTVIDGSSDKTLVAQGYTISNTFGGETPCWIISDDLTDQVKVWYDGAIYDLAVAGVRVTSANASNVMGETIEAPKTKGSVSYDAATNTLTLDGADLTQYNNNAYQRTITYYGSGNLKIALKGNNKVSRVNHNSDENVATLSFVKAEGADDCQLELNYPTNEESVLSFFKEVDFGELYTVSDGPMTFKPFYGDENSNTLNYLLLDNNSGVTQLVITSAKTYPLWVAGTQVTEANKANVKDDNTNSVSFAYDADNEKNTLNLSNALLDKAIVSGLDNLTIHLSGTSAIESQSNIPKAIQTINSDATLTFTSDVDQASLPNGYLMFGDYVTTPFDGFASYNYDNGLAYGRSDGTRSVGLISYFLIGDYEINSAKLSVIGDLVSFDNQTNTLSLNGIGDAGDIQYHQNEDITIEFDGSNLTGYIAGTGNGNLHIKKAADAETPELNINGNYDGLGAISGFNNCTWEDGLYMNPYEGNTVLSGVYFDTETGHFAHPTSSVNNIIFSTVQATATPSIWIGTTEVNQNGTFGTIEGASFAVDGDVNVLTLSGTEQGASIVSSLPNLTIKLSGTNSMSQIVSSDPTAELTIVKDAEAESATLNLATELASVISGFANVGLSGMYYVCAEMYEYNTTSKKFVNPIDVTEISMLTISSTVAYPLWIAGTQVTGANASNIFNDDYSSASYADNTLTLTACQNNGTDYDYAIMIGGEENLNIDFIGYNSLGSTDTKTFLYAKDACTVTFSTDETLPGQMECITKNAGDFKTDNVTIDAGDLSMTEETTTATTTIKSSSAAGIYYFGCQSFSSSFGGDYPYGDEEWYFTNAVKNSGNSYLPPIVSSSEGTSKMKHGEGYDMIKTLTLQCLPLTGDAAITVSLKDLEDETKVYATGTLTSGIVTLTPNAPVTYENVCLVFTSTSSFSFVPLAVQTEIKPDAPFFTPYKQENPASFAFEFGGDEVRYTIDYASDDLQDVEETSWTYVDDAITIAGPCTVTAYVVKDGVESDHVKGKYFGPTSTKQTIVLGSDPVELAIAPAIEEGDGIMIYGIESSYISFDEETQKATATTMGSGSFPVPLKYVAEEYEEGNTFILNYSNFEMQVEVVTALDIEFVDDNSWASYYATENLAVPEGLTAYVVSAVNEETGAVTVASIEYIPANNAVLLKREQNGAASGYTAAAYTGSTSTFTNLLGGSTSATNISSLGSGPVYVLFNDKFKRAISGTIPARRAYLALNAAVAPVSAPQYLTISIVDGNSTAIDTLTVDDNSNDSWYSIDGLKLKGKPQRKGLYINNGKKVYINNNK